MVCESFLQTSIPPRISIFYAKEGVSRLFVQNFLSHSTEKFRWGILRWVRKFRVAKNFMLKKGISLKSVKTLCLTVPINFVGEPFCVSKEFWYRKFSSQVGGKLHAFVENFFHLRGPKKLRQGTILCFRKFLVGKNILWIRGGGGYHNFPSKFLSHCTKIFHWRTLWCFRKLLLSKIFMHKSGASWFYRNF